MAILEALIGKSAKKKQKDEEAGDKKKKDPIPHIASLKDVVEIHFSTVDDTKSPADDKTKKNNKKSVPETWVCPASQEPVLEASKGSKFIYIVPCGHVFAESAYNELKFTKCFTCDGPVDGEKGVVALNPMSPRDVEESEERYQKLKDQGLTHSLAPIKKAKKSSSKGDKKTKRKHQAEDGFEMEKKKRQKMIAG